MKCVILNQTRTEKRISCGCPSWAEPFFQIPQLKKTAKKRHSDSSTRTHQHDPKKAGAVTPDFLTTAVKTDTSKNRQNDQVMENRVDPNLQLFSVLMNRARVGA
jgi:hypothetical protein